MQPMCGFLQLQTGFSRVQMKAEGIWDGAALGPGEYGKNCGALQALPHKGLIVGVGLDSTELGNPCPQYQAVFERAAQEGLKCVAHAGVQTMLWTSPGF